ncbi:class I SAM-dependent methyltransferase [Actinomadura coerulea]|uniref:class I SAM-dependent methyltransferase n=1 Tax=Actinomadura coerulea TaxID=46159 RepID=UPI003441C30C
MAPQDALHGWDDAITAQAYAAFTRAYPMYNATSRDLARRARLTTSGLVIDLCGGTGATATAILDLVPPAARVISVDNAPAMQRIGRRLVPDPRLTWIAAAAEDLDDHVPAATADAVVCNSAIWKTDTPEVFTAVRRVLRPGGRFVFNIGGGFAGVHHRDEQTARTGPSLNSLIRQIAARDYGYTPPPADHTPKLSPSTVSRQLAQARMSVLATDIVAQHTTMAEKKAWLSIPVFARPDGDLSHAQRMDILTKAYALTTPQTPTVTSWLVVVAQRPEEQP